MRELQTSRSSPTPAARTWLEPAGAAVPVDGLLDPLREAHVGRPIQIPPRARAVAHPLVEELVALVAREHHRLVGQLAVALAHQSGTLDYPSRQRNAQERALAERGLGLGNQLGHGVHGAV